MITKGDDLDDVKPVVETGTKLPNGAIVLAVRDNVILARGDKGVVIQDGKMVPTKVEYITWKWDGKDPGSTVWGHYFKTLSEAAHSFEDRK